MLSLVSDECPRHFCNVATTYDYLKSTSDDRLGIKITTDEYIYNKNSMLYTKFDAEIVRDTFKLKIDEYNRETLFRIKFASITNSSEVYDSEFDGFLGLAPYTKDNNNFIYNFLF